MAREGGEETETGMQDSRAVCGCAHSHYPYDRILQVPVQGVYFCLTSAALPRLSVALPQPSVSQSARSECRPTGRECKVAQLDTRTQCGYVM